MWLGRVDQVSAAAGATIGHMTGPSMMQALLRFESGVTAIFEAMLARQPPTWSSRSSRSRLNRHHEHDILDLGY